MLPHVCLCIYRCLPCYLRTCRDVPLLVLSFLVLSFLVLKWMNQADSINQSINQSIHQSIGQFLCLSLSPFCLRTMIHVLYLSLLSMLDQSRTQSINDGTHVQSINQSISRSSIQSIHQSTNGGMTRSFNQSVNHSINQSVHQS